MSDDEKKPAPQPGTTSSSSAKAPTVPTQPAKQPPTVKTPAISRRAFVVGALGASTLLAIGAFAPPSMPSWDILNPQLPTKEGRSQVTTFDALDKKYKAAVAAGNLYSPSDYSEFFYFPYPVTASPYYKNVITRLPGPPDVPTQLVNPFYPNDQILSKVAAFNLTCVHLRCIVNPGFAGTPGSGEFRLQCPCHGSQYRLTDAVPVAGPAYDLGLLPLPRVKLEADAAGNITATDLDGTAGVGRTD
jgi:Rieske Fe-S protein